jgi:hypothetical protein
VDEFASYDGGLCWMNGAPRSPASDLLFKIAGSAETSVQISNMADPAAGAGQLLAGVRLDASSGIYTCPFRASSLTALAEILAQLHAGNSTGVRLAADITSDRYFRLAVQPDPAAATLYVTPAGKSQIRPVLPSRRGLLPPVSGPSSVESGANSAANTSR